MASWPISVGHHTMSQQIILRFALIMGLSLAAAVPAFARLGFWVNVAPPAPIVEPVPPVPAPGYSWRPGYWAWDGVKYVWVPGTYVVAPYPNAVWAGGHWVPRRHGWVWADGHWR
jgi:hypothetical protein